MDKLIQIILSPIENTSKQGEEEVTSYFPIVVFSICVIFFILFENVINPLMIELLK